MQTQYILYGRKTDKINLKNFPSKFILRQVTYQHSGNYYLKLKSFYERKQHDLLFTCLSKMKGHIEQICVACAF